MPSLGKKSSILVSRLKSFNMSPLTPEQVLLLLYSVQFLAQKMLPRNCILVNCVNTAQNAELARPPSSTLHNHLLPGLTFEEAARLPGSTVGYLAAFRRTGCQRLWAHRDGSRWRNAGLSDPVPGGRWERTLMAQAADPGAAVIQLKTVPASPARDGTVAACQLPHRDSREEHCVRRTSSRWLVGQPIKPFSRDTDGSSSIKRGGAKLAQWHGWPTGHNPSNDC